MGAAGAPRPGRAAPTAGPAMRPRSPRRSATGPRGRARRPSRRAARARPTRPTTPPTRPAPPTASSEPKPTRGSDPSPKPTRGQTPSHQPTQGVRPLHTGRLKGSDPFTRADSRGQTPSHEPTQGVRPLHTSRLGVRPSRTATFPRAAFDRACAPAFVAAVAAAVLGALGSAPASAATWSAPQNLSSAHLFIDQPRLVAARNGAVLATWAWGDGTGAGARAGTSFAARGPGHPSFGPASALARRGRRDGRRPGGVRAPRHARGRRAAGQPAPVRGAEPPDGAHRACGRKPHQAANAAHGDADPRGRGRLQQRRRRRGGVVRGPGLTNGPRLRRAPAPRPPVRRSTAARDRPRARRHGGGRRVAATSWWRGMARGDRPHPHPSARTRRLPRRRAHPLPAGLVRRPAHGRHLQRPCGCRLERAVRERGRRDRPRVPSRSRCAPPAPRRFRRARLLEQLGTEFGPAHDRRRRGRHRADRDRLVGLRRGHAAREGRAVRPGPALRGAAGRLGDGRERRPQRPRGRPERPPDRHLGQRLVRRRTRCARRSRPAPAGRSARRRPCHRRRRRATATRRSTRTPTSRPSCGPTAPPAPAARSATFAQAATRTP